MDTCLSHERCSELKISLLIVSNKIDEYLIHHKNILKVENLNQKSCDIAIYGSLILSGMVGDYYELILS